MITFFTGTPGSGKTYEAVHKIVLNLKLGRKVYTNIDGMEDDRCHEALKTLAGLDDMQFAEQFHHLGFYVNKEVKPQPNDLEGKINLAWFWEYCEPGSLIVMDEVQKIFVSRDTQKPHNVAFADWASTHRHLGYDLIIITQVAERIEIGVRTLTEWNYVFRKVNFFGGSVQKKYLCNSFAGEFTTGQPLKKQVRTYNGKIFLCYKSYVAKDIKEQGFMTHVNILNHPIFFAIPVVLGVCLYMVFFKSSFATGDIFGVNKVQNRNFDLVGTANAKPIPPIENKPQSITSDIPVNVTPSATPTTPQNTINSSPVVATVLTRRVKLNYMQVFHKNKTSEIKILFDHSVFTKETFPYPITLQRGHLYADIPINEETIVESPEHEDPTVLAITDK